MGRSRSRSRKKEKKSKHKRDKSKSKDRPRRAPKASKFSSGPPAESGGNPLLMGAGGGGAQNQSMGNMSQILSMGQQPTSDIQSILSFGNSAPGGGDLGHPALSMGKTVPSITEEQFMESNQIPANSDLQTPEQKQQLATFRIQQIEQQNKQQQNAQLSGALQINMKSSIHQSILQKAGINIKKSDGDNKIISAINIPQIPPSSILTMGAGANPALLATLADNSRIKKKVFVPQNGFNYTGLIIGPGGSNQKKMEELSGCKILVRGKGSQKEGQPPQPDDHEDQHVLIVGESEANIAKAQAEVERILFADEETRNKIRLDQLKQVAQIKNSSVGGVNFGETSNLQVGEATPISGVNASLTTPYGPPSEDAYIIPVPEDCVGLVIGKNGDTIKQLQERSGASRVQAAMENQGGSEMRNIFVEGSKESVEVVKKMLREIVENQRRMKQGLQNKGNRVEFGIPHNMVGLVIGKGGETIKNINQKTGAFVVLSKEPEHENMPKKMFLISGSPQQIEAAKKEMDLLVEGGIKYQQQKLQQQQGGYNNRQNNYNNNNYNQDRYNNYNDDRGMPPPPPQYNSYGNNDRNGSYSGNNNNSRDSNYNRGGSRDNYRDNYENDRDSRYSSSQQQYGQGSQQSSSSLPPTPQQQQQQQQYSQFVPPNAQGKSDQDQQQNKDDNNMQKPSESQQQDQQQQQQNPEQQQQQAQQPPPMFQPPTLMPPGNPMMAQQLLMSAVEGPQIETIGADEAGEFETKRRRRRKKD